MLRYLVPLVAHDARVNPDPIADESLNILLAACAARGLNSVIREASSIMERELAPAATDAKRRQDARAAAMAA